MEKLYSIAEQGIEEISVHKENNKEYVVIKIKSHNMGSKILIYDGTKFVKCIDQNLFIWFFSIGFGVLCYGAHANAGHYEEMLYGSLDHKPIDIRGKSMRWRRDTSNGHLIGSDIDSTYDLGLHGEICIKTPSSIAMKIFPGGLTMVVPVFPGRVYRQGYYVCESK